MNTYSSNISICLILGDSTRIDLAGVHGNTCIFRRPMGLSPCYAELVATVDGDELRQTIHLFAGAVEDSDFADFTLVADNSIAA